MQYFPELYGIIYIYIYSFQSHIVTLNFHYLLFLPHNEVICDDVHVYTLQTINFYIMYV